MAGTDFESPALLNRWVPITQLMRSGTLQRRGGRLTYTLGSQPWTAHPYLDAPVAEMHSVAVTPIGITIWHGKRRYRFAFVVGPPGVILPGASVQQTDKVIDAEIVNILRNYSVAETWANNLENDVGSPPPGLRVPKPWSYAKWLACVGVVLFVAIALAVAVPLLIAG